MDSPTERCCLCNVIFAGTRLAFNTLIVISASARLPEFRGYRSRRYPGQPPPRPPRIAPRRLQLPPTFVQDQEWTRIGARRKRILDCGVPAFGEPVQVTVGTEDIGNGY